MRSTRSALRASIAFVAILAAGCSDAPPTSSDGMAAGRGASPVIVSGADFGFFPGIGDESDMPEGDFDGSLSPVVQICRLVGTNCAGVIATFSRTSGGIYSLGTASSFWFDGNTYVDDHYTAVWHTQRFALNPAADYRVRVLVNNREVGYANIDILGHSSQHAKDGFVGVLNGQPLDIRFFLGEFGAED